MKSKNIIILFIGMLLFSMGNAQVKQTSIEDKKDLNSIETIEFLKQDSTIVIVDVRTPREFNAGHIKGAININIGDRNFSHNILKLKEEGKKYLVYCRTKNRSTVAVNYMLKNGFKQVYKMIDGMSGWNRNKLPTEK